MGTAFGVVPRWPGAIHLVALPSLDLAADLSWPGRPLGAGGLAGLLALAGLRMAVLALLAASSDGPRWRLDVVSYAAASPLVLLDFVAHAALYSRLLGVALGLLTAAILLFSAAPFSAARAGAA